MKQSANAILTWTVFLGLLLSVCYYYRYLEIVQWRPQSIHKWRQSDCASLALNYYQHQLSFFQPHTHNLTSDQGTSSACATSEVPILYYAVAQLYRMFGYHDFVFRLVNTLIFLSGLIFLFMWFQLVLRNAFWSVLATFFFFSSPVLVYYGNNFLSDSAALAFSIMAWYCFYRYFGYAKRHSFYGMLFFLMLAAFCKVTALINVFAIMGISFILKTGNEKSDQAVLPAKLGYRELFWMLSVPALTFLWILYARVYNKNHDCSYFSTTLFPVWDYSPPQILDLLKHIWVNWGSAYFHPASQIFLVLGLIGGIYFYRRSGKMTLLILCILIIQCLFIFILQFWAFADHDYYTVHFFIVPVFILILFLKGALQEHSGILNAWPVKFAAACFVVFNIHHARLVLNDRYNGWANDYKDNIEYYDLNSFLREHGISNKDTIISLPDKSHVSLYLMNLKGWTAYTDARFNQGIPVKYNQDSLGIERSILHGARYLFIRNFNEIKSRDFLRSFCTHLVAQKGDLFVFDLRNKHQNFRMPEEVTLFQYVCDAESLNEAGTHFKSTADSMFFEFAVHQSAVHARSGSHSVCLYKEKPYGMTVRIRNTRPGEYISMEVWRYDPESAQAGLVAAIPDRQVYYNKNEVIQKDGNWERLKLQFQIDSSQAGKMLEMYLYNPKEGKVFFDDLSIRRFELR